MCLWGLRGSEFAEVSDGNDVVEDRGECFFGERLLMKRH